MQMKLVQIGTHFKAVSLPISVSARSYAATDSFWRHVIMRYLLIMTECPTATY